LQFAKNLGKSLLDDLKSKSDETNRLSAEYAYKDNSFLLKKAKTGNWKEKTAAAKIIQDRGGLKNL